MYTGPAEAPKSGRFDVKGILFMIISIYGNNTSK
jgi:hypothetical protein